MPEAIPAGVPAGQAGWPARSVAHRSVSRGPSELERTWIEIDRAALAGNLRAFRSLLGSGVAVLPVVKSNGYGHGLESIVRILHAEGVDVFGVQTVEEAHALRRILPAARAVILGMAFPEQFPEVVEAGHELTVSNQWGWLDRLNALALERRRTVPVHIKVETGIHRQGVRFTELDRMVLLLKGSPGLRVAGTSTHFAASDEPAEAEFTRRQLVGLSRALLRLERAGIRPGVVHAAATAAAVLYPESRLDQVRLGIGLYGYLPSEETRRAAAGLPLRPVLSWRTRILQLTTAAPGATVGYGRSYRSCGAGRLAVLPVGYADGIGLDQSNRGEVLVRGRRAPIRGRVCMNLTMVDVTGMSDVAEGDMVTILGEDSGARLNAIDIADRGGSIPYEVLTRIHSALPRRIV